MTAAGLATKIYEQGYPNTKVLLGGYNAWKAAGFPLGATPRSRRIRVGSLLVSVIDRLSIRQWILLWGTMVLLCAFCFWALSRWSDHGLQSGGDAYAPGASGLLDALYFSLVTATSLGYGDLSPLGLSRAVAVMEAVAGMFLFGAIIAKLLSHRQEELVHEIHQLTFQERLGRIQGNLHVLIADFHAVSEMATRDVVKPERISARVESAALIFERELSSVRDLLYQPGTDVGEDILESILITLHAALREFSETLSQSRGVCSLEIHNLSRIASMAREICADCVPADHSARLVERLDRVKEIALLIGGDDGSS